jgi:CHAD domain-containing protein
MPPSAEESTEANHPQAKFYNLASKRLERYATLFAKALVNDAPDTIHDLRVASRRLQQALRVFARDAKSSGARKLLRTPRKVRRAFGACRNLDASLALVEKKTAAAATTSLRQAWEAVRLWLEQQRSTELERARRELRSHDLVDFTVRVQERLAAIDRESREDTTLNEKAREAFAAWLEALESAKTNPQVEQIHAYRIAGKRLRYQIEPLAELGDASVKPLVQGLKKLQDGLGDWHDHCVLRQQVAEFIGRPGFLAEEPGKSRALLLEMERDKQRDHLAINELISSGEQLATKGTELYPSQQSGDAAAEGQ